MTGKMMLATAWMLTDLAEFVCGKGFVGQDASAMFKNRHRGP
jgi:hypothetical protein